MPLTEQNVIDKIEVYEDGAIGIRTATRVLRDGVQIAETYSREAVEPGADVTGKPDKVRAIAGAVWTPAVIASYRAKSAASKPRP